MRRLHPADPQARSAYPLRLLPRGALGMSRIIRGARRCDVCEQNAAAVSVLVNALMGRRALWGSSIDSKITCMLPLWVCWLMGLHAFHEACGWACLQWTLA